MSPSKLLSQRLLSLADYQINQVDHIHTGHDMSTWLKPLISFVRAFLSSLFRCLTFLGFFCASLSDSRLVIMLHFIPQDDSLVLLVCRLKVLKH